LDIPENRTRCQTATIGERVSREYLRSVSEGAFALALSGRHRVEDPGAGQQPVKQMSDDGLKKVYV
jgi:hypothetical protein